MISINIGGNFTWLHEPATDWSTTGVIVCPGLKGDKLTAYATLRQLGDDLSARGYPTLRLHYLGTGNSPDAPDDPNYWEAWQSQIHHAADWLRGHGVQHIVLCGFRFGGALAAAVAAQRQDVSGLVLLAPVVRGRPYIRQLKMETALLPSGHLVAGRVLLSSAAVATITALELKTLRLPSHCKVVVFAHSSPALSECIAVWQASHLPFGDLNPMLRPTFANHETSATIEPILDWLDRNCPPDRRAPHRVPTADILTMTETVETPVWFGGNSDLFGILCQPRQPRYDLLLLMANPSGDPHCASTTVELARMLASHGMPSFRFDFAGIGDSGPAQRSHVHEVDRVGDFTAAMDKMLGYGYQSFAVYGMCSGAYHGYLAAAADPRIRHALLIDLPFFIPIPGQMDVRKPSQFLALMRTRAWWFALYGKMRHGNLNLASRFNLRHRWRKRPVVLQKLALGPAALSKQVNLLFLMSHGDVSIDVLQRELGSCRLVAGSASEVHPGLQHGMTSQEMRRTVAERFILFLINGKEGTQNDTNNPRPRLGHRWGWLHRLASM